MTDTEQLRADIATLEAAQETLDRHNWCLEAENVVAHAIESMRDELAKAEADPWAGAKGFVESWTTNFGPNTDANKVGKYVRHLESKVAELEAELVKRPVVWCVLMEGGLMRNRCGCIKVFTDEQMRSSPIPTDRFKPYKGEPIWT